MKTVKAILLKGRGQREEIIELDAENPYKDIFKVFGVRGFSEISYHTFGKGYTAIWKCDQNDNTCMEITRQAGANRPIFIDSKVIIINEDTKNEISIDVDIDEVKKHFNTEGAFWALIKN
jgi:hypothetical protein